MKYAAAVGGTLSAEHGVGKLKRDYLHFFYNDQQLREMAALKKALDPNGILGRGNLILGKLIRKETVNMFTHVNVLTKEIIGAAIEVHRHLGPGLLESAYKQCLAKELQLKDHSASMRMAVTA